jgi:RNA 2',3'-cyclic 3'-phosphodiesterase
VRLFIAINLPADVRATAWGAAEPLRAAIPAGVAWVREEALHVTLRFLGEQPPEVVDRLARELEPALSSMEPPRIELTGVGVFPTVRRPRVLWLGGPANSTVTELYHVVERTCARLGVEPEGREFRAHVTIGRVRQGAAVDVVALDRAAGDIRLRTGFVARSVDVMESELTPAGARYRVLAAIPIGGLQGG